MVKDELTLEDYKEIAERKGFILSPHAEKIIARVNACNGYCPCRTKQEIVAHPENDYECPCSMMEEDVKEWGHCCCHLFLRPEEEH